MGVSRTRTVKNKHATAKSGIGGSKSSKAGPSDGIVKSKRKGSAPPSKQVKPKTALELLKKKKKVYSEKELGIPQLNMVTPVGVTKPKGKKKGKVFVDDKVRRPPSAMHQTVQRGADYGYGQGGETDASCAQQETMGTILSLVQAEKEGQIESKMMKARQMEEIREARRIEAEAKEQERKSKLEETKDSLRRKRKRNKPAGDDGADGGIKDVALAGTNAAKPKKKRVSFA